VTALWEEAVRLPEYAGPPVGAHGDLMPGNVLVTGGRLTSVIGFGCVRVGDPAVDLIVAWYLLPPAVRPIFRDAVGADEAAWARGRGWAPPIALVALPYWHTDPPVAEAPRHVIAEILAEAGQPGDRPGSGAGSWPSPCRGVTRPRPPPPRRRCRSFPWSAWS
jgi:aminoglycoside phosphotransferase (APT) family kinase protein